jgi:calcineurin-like phosphoesterase family protein
MIWVTSDLHFNHAGIIKYTNRPFSSVEEMNDAMIELWNERVRRNDTVHVVGDFGFHSNNSTDLEAIFSALRGHKHLAIGNHDEKNPRVLKLPWVTKRELYTIKENGCEAVVCHYPLETWKSPNRCFMLHGHSHGSLKRKIPRRYDVGPDAIGWDVFMRSFDEWAGIAASEKYDPQDHHEEDKS